MTYETLAFDRASVRRIDDNGFMHVAVSPFTREQVAPYYGYEIPGWEELKLNPQKIYYGYRPAEELSKPETVVSINGIPVQQGHHAEFADDPAHETRVGAAGTDAKWEEPYLTNSLVIYDKKAQDGITSGAIRELSLAYHYRPDFSTPGEWKGQHYDFVMRDIRGNHVALVEEGRAGKDVLVYDSKLGINTMDNAKLLEMLRAVVAALEAKASAKDEAAEVVETEEKVEAVDEAEAPAEPAVEAPAEASVEAPAEAPVEPAEDEEPVVEAEAEEAPVEDACKDEAILSEDEAEEFGRHDDIDLDDPKQQRAFAYGVRYGEAKEKEEPKKLDSEHESEGLKKALGEDSKGHIKEIADQIYTMQKKRFADIHAAAEATRGVLGRIKVMAYDSAEQVYSEACKKLGLKCTDATARDVFNAYGSIKKTLAQDSVAKTPVESGVLGKLLGSVKVN